ncbi:hypothetical protein [Antribacter gilvus]|uniref:hypothetical protein n=1 Tax=Antribacter gilvus TaxID=2304675 RepID=UPI000F7B9843|nr:hypothetical protein [Antribacter gilvus]
MSPSTTPAPEGPATSHEPVAPGNLAWRTDHLLGEPFEEAPLGEATLVRYAPAEVVHPGERPASGSKGVHLQAYDDYLSPDAPPEERRQALDQRGYFLMRTPRPSRFVIPLVIRSWWDRVASPHKA